jgi:hypothetical protein
MLAAASAAALVGLLALLKVNIDGVWIVILFGFADSHTKCNTLS